MEQERIEYRRGTLEDLAAVALLDEKVFGPRHSYPAFVLRQFYDLGFYLVVAQAGEADIVGYALCAMDAEEPLGWIMALAVDADFRGQGIAGQLISECEDNYFNGQVDAVLLTVDPENKGAIHLYEKVGFLTEELYADYFGAGEDRLLMVKELE